MTARASITLALLALPGATVAAGAVLWAPHTGEIIPVETLWRPTPDQIRGRTALISANITFTVTYLDPPGVGFNDTTLGTERRAAVDSVLAYLDGVLDHPGGQLDIEFQPSQFDGAGFLGRAGVFYQALDGFQPGAAFRHITTGVDPSAESAEVVVTMDLGFNWHAGTDPPSPGEFDLASIILHELGHGLGFASLTTRTGSSEFIEAVGTDTFSTYDDLLFQLSPPTRVWDALTFAFLADTLEPGALSNALVFEGTAAEAAFSQPPAVWAPNPWQPGSSISHWSNVAPIPTAAVMRPFASSGVAKREFEPFEVGALEDLGYRLVTPPTAVRDPGTYR